MYVTWGLMNVLDAITRCAFLPSIHTLIQGETIINQIPITSILRTGVLHIKGTHDVVLCRAGVITIWVRLIFVQRLGNTPSFF